MSEPSQAVAAVWELLLELPSRQERRGEGLGFFDRRKLARASAALAKLANDGAEEPYALWARGRLANLQAELEPAAALLVRATAVMNEAALWHELALVQLELGQGEAAEQSARAVAELAPQERALRVTYARALLVAGHFKRALGVIANVCKEDPDDADARRTIERIRQVLNGAAPAPTRWTAAE
jgi:predicted Zn-dependent protease